MAQRKRSDRAAMATATRGRSAMTSEVVESEIARMRVDEIRDQLRKRGIPGVSALRKDDLVKTFVKTLNSERGSTGTTAKTTRTTVRSAEKGRTAGPDGKGTTGGDAGGAGGNGKRPAAGDAGGGIREGGATSRSLRYAQRISSPDERPERPGRTLVTVNHEIIRRWARARKARPATVRGTEQNGRAGVLTFSFPLGRQERTGRDDRLKQITWDEWFTTFDTRGLNFIYQESRADGRQSNFFRSESPHRQDA